MDEQGTSYSPPPPTLSTCSNLTSAHRNSNLRTSHHQLSAFPSNLHLFSYFAARSHAKTLAKPRIFLPHLVASLEQVDETDIMVKPDGVQRGLQYQLEALPVPPRLSRGSKIQSLSAQEKPTTSRASKNGFLRMNCRK
ncbi:nucleoside diphosphate kinase 2, chloroplastic-like isoform X2 [Malus sylvestris]|uniref:nucleoside diphosphate kinase 2, chloroplastic-like isoform X2 n=1 Tax=Malus sylvestris TaxID=3752 RepID=UPI0021ABD115|nr:nucleoside diphosphate kinase 2, chloroplastic-like isoform X2 [Malus sylvestris]